MRVLLPPLPNANDHVFPVQMTCLLDHTEHKSNNFRSLHNRCTPYTKKKKITIENYSFLKF